MRKTLLLTAVFAVLACDSSSEPVVTEHTWTAALEGEGEYASVAASLEVVSKESLTADIDVEGAEPETVYQWEIAAGSCASPGNRVGAASDYPELETDENGAASGTVTIGHRLEPTSSYHATVYFIEEGEGEEEDTEVVVACGALEVEDEE